MPTKRNLLANLPDALPAEITETLLRGNDTVRLERIVSDGQASPPDFWYDQEQAEWVLILQGAAGLEFEGEAEIAELALGDCLLIPAHRRHRVAWTAKGQQTVWLALFFEEVVN